MSGVIWRCSSCGGGFTSYQRQRDHECLMDYPDVALAVAEHGCKTVPFGADGDLLETIRRIADQIRSGRLRP